jgi:hypothetical protein
VLSATSSNVFAALSSTDGDIGMSASAVAFAYETLKLTRSAAWRHVFDASDPILLFRPSKHGVSCLVNIICYLA